MDEDDVDLVL